MTQKELASELKLTAGAVSKYIAVGPGHVRLRPERVLRLVEVLKQRLGECQSLASRDEPSALSLLPTAAIHALQAEIDDLLAGDEAIELFQGAVLALPAGPLPVNAMNYVSRSADAEVDKILAARVSPANIVVAPLDGGVSSFLNRVYWRARNIQNCYAEIVHLDTAFAEEQTFTQSDLFRYLFRRLGVPGDQLVPEENIAVAVERMKDEFNNWAHEKWSGASLVVLVIDGLDQIFKLAGSVAEPLAVINWLSELRGEAAVGKPPYDKLVLFAALSGQTWSAAHASPYASQASTLKLDKFSEPEIERVFQQLDITQSYNVGEIFKLFHGHPFLTQQFAWAMHRGASHDDARKVALNLSSAYESHWERMKSEILLLIRKDRSQTADTARALLQNILAKIVEVVDRGGKNLTSEMQGLWDVYGRDLRVFGLVDADANTDTLTMCEFYRHVIQREQTTIFDERRPNSNNRMAS
jgi:hypothetical protein